MDTFTIILIASICLVIGAVAGSLFANLRDNPEAPPEKVPNGRPGVQSLQPPAAQPPASAPDPKRVDIAALWRERPSGILRVDIEGKTLRSSGELNEDQRRRLASVVEDLRAWLSAPVGTGSDATLVPPPPARVIAMPPPASSPAPANLPAAPAPARPAKTVAIAKNAKDKAQTKTMVEVIDEILQSQTAGTPLENMGLRLLDSPTGGVVVWIGLNHYDGVNAVPDAAAQAAIRRAVKTWEERPGA
jgi:hypothetical protein